MRDNKTIFFYFFLALLFVTIFSNNVLAASYYVSPNGTATWPNCTSLSNPCKASNTDRDFLKATAGDTVYFLDGIYSGLQQNPNINYRYPAWWPENSGTSDTPITFKSLNVNGAHLIGFNTGVSVRVIGTYLRDYIVWDGFIVSAVNEHGNSIMAGTNFFNTTGSIIRNCEIRGATHSTGGANNHEGIRIEDASNITVENCHVHGFIETSNNRNTSGLKTYRVNNLTIKNCEFNNNTTGIYIKGAPHNNVLIQNCWLHSNYIGSDFSVGEQANSNFRFINNVFSKNSYINFVLDIRLNSKMNDTLVRNNTFIGTNGFGWVGSDTGKGPTIYNNIFYNMSIRSLTSHGDDAAPLLAEDHNRLDFTNPLLMREYGSNQTAYASLAAWIASTELYGGNKPGSNSTTADPMFLNTSGTFSQLQDFALSNDSPLRGAGRNGADIGANVSEIGISQSALDPPASLRIITNP